MRIVDPVQYRKRVDDFDFDIVVQRFGFSSTPGDTLRTFFTSQAATMKGSQNVGGISDPVIDALVERVIAADSRPASDGRMQGSRPGHPQRALLGAALVQALPLARVLGRVRSAGGATALRAGIPETWWSKA